MSIINTLNKDTHYFTLDLHGGVTLAEPLNFKQYDHNSRILAIELTVHNVSLDLTDARVDIWVYKADGHLVQKAVDKGNIDLENSTVMIPLTAQMLSILPEIECEIVVTYANKSVLSFPTFKVQIEDSNVDVETVVSTSEFNLFYDALYRMEQWMRDYLEKYRIIDASFTQKLAEIDEEKIRIIDEFRALSGDLVQQDAVRFEELKQMTIGEFAEWFKQAKAVFAYAGREIEKRFNELWEKCNDLNTEMQEIKEEINTTVTIVNNNLKTVQELTTNINMQNLLLCMKMLLKKQRKWKIHLTQTKQKEKLLLTMLNYKEQQILKKHNLIEQLHIPMLKILVIVITTKQKQLEILLTLRRR